jgi:hypothetical protein
MPAVCIECGAAEAAIQGYCEPCADEIARLDHEDHVNGNWERRTLEDEMYVWDR